jgi:hypothetical protein
VQVGEIAIARGGLGTAWVRCPMAGARKLARDRKVAVGWSWATVTVIPKRPLQCYRCLELGHVRATCTSAVDRGNLCHRCGKSGHKTRESTAAKPNCPLCEALDAPAGYRMGGIACAPPRIRLRRPPGRQINNNYRRSPINVMRNDPGRSWRRVKFNPKIIQCNLGHARRAQDLLYQTIRESGVALAVIAEPYNVPNATNWAQDTSGRAAII